MNSQLAISLQILDFFHHSGTADIVAQRHCEHLFREKQERKKLSQKESDHVFPSQLQVMNETAYVRPPPIHISYPFAE